MINFAKQKLKDSQNIILLFPWIREMNLTPSNPSGLYLMDDGSLGFILEIQPISFETVDIEKRQNFTTMAKSIIEEFQPGDLIQFIIRCDKNFGNKLDEFINLPEILMKEEYEHKFEPNPIIKKCMEQKCEILKNWKSKNFAIKQMHIYFTYRFYPKWTLPKNTDILNLCIKGIDSFQDDQFLILKSAIENGMRTLDSVMTRFKDIGIRSSVIHEDDLIKLLYPILNPQTQSVIKVEQIQKQYEKTIRNRLIQHNSCENRFDGVKMENTYYSVLSIVDYPSYIEDGIIMGEYTGRSIVDPFDDFYMVFNCQITDKERSIGYFRKQANKLMYFANLLLRNIPTHITDKFRDFDHFETDVQQDNCSIINTRIHILINGKTEKEIRDKTSKIRSVLSLLNFKVAEEKEIGNSLFFTLFPLSYSASFEYYIQREQTMTSRNLAELAPLTSVWRGNESKYPVHIFVNRRGEIVTFDEAEYQNQNSLIYGPIGSGKSMVAADNMANEAFIGSRLYILDKTESDDACSYLRFHLVCSSVMKNFSKYHEYNINNPTTINIYKGELDENKITSIGYFIQALIQSADPRKQTLSMEETNAINIAATKLAKWKKENNKKEVYLSDHIKFLEESLKAENLDKEGKDIAKKLQIFKKGQLYGKFFDGPDELDIENYQVNIFQFRQLFNKQTLAGPVVMAIFERIRSTANNTEYPHIKEKRKKIILEEMWWALNMETTRNLFEEIVRTWRKEGIRVQLITQDLLSFLSLTKGRQILNNINTTYILPQSPQGVRDSMDAFKLDERQAELLQTIAMKKGEYNEIFIYTREGQQEAGVFGNKHSGVVRFILPPLLYWMFTTNPEDIRYLNRIKNKVKGNMYEAIQICAKEYPTGV